MHTHQRPSHLQAARAQRCRRPVRTATRASGDRVADAVRQQQRAAARDRVETWLLASERGSARLIGRGRVGGRKPGQSASPCGPGASRRPYRDLDPRVRCFNWRSRGLRRSRARSSDASRGSVSSRGRGTPPTPGEADAPPWGESPADPVRCSIGARAGAFNEVREGSETDGPRSRRKRAAARPKSAEFGGKRRSG
jgi:hypothetical protein